MKAVFLAIIAIIGLVGVFIGVPPMILLGFYTIVAISPIVVILLKKDLTNGILVWFLLVLFSSSGGEVRLPMLPDISFYRIMWVVLLLIFFAQIALKERKFLAITKLEIMMILFCLVCLVSMIRAGTIFKVGQGLALRNFLNGYAIPFSIFFLAKNVVCNEYQIKKVFYFLLVVSIYLAITGIFEHYNLAYLVFPRYIMDPGAGIHFGRARGPFVQAAVNGTVLGIIFLTSTYLIMLNHNRVLKRFLAFFVSLVPIVIFFTYTRACWLGFILSLSAVALFYPRFRKIFFFGFILIAIISLFNWANITSADRSVGGVAAMGPIYDRINLYAASSKMFLEKPIFGFGFDTFQKVSPEFFSKVSGIPYQGVGLSPHDTLTGILVELGLVGFIPLILIFFYIFRHSLRLYRRLSANLFLGKGLVATFWGISIVFIINMQFIEMRFFQFPNSLFFLLAGIIVGLDQRVLLSKMYKGEERFK